MNTKTISKSDEKIIDREKAIGQLLIVCGATIVTLSCITFAETSNIVWTFAALYGVAFGFSVGLIGVVQYKERYRTLKRMQDWQTDNIPSVSKRGDRS